MRVNLSSVREIARRPVQYLQILFARLRADCENDETRRHAATRASRRRYNDNDRRDEGGDASIGPVHVDLEREDTARTTDGTIIAGWKRDEVHRVIN